MSFKIMIDHPKKTYLPGEFIVGRVRCTITIPDYIEVWVKLVGEENTLPIKTDQKQNKAKCKRGLKAYFLETKNTVLRSEFLNEGQYEFRFSLTLPMGIPSSFMGQYGDVRYYLRGRMYRHGHEKYDDLIQFKVFSPIDLNEMDNLPLSPSTYADEPGDESTWSFCGGQYPRLEVKLEKNVFVVGDTVNVMVTIKKKLDISSLRVNLIMKIKAKVGYEKEDVVIVSERVASDQDYRVKNGKKKTYLFALKIPESLRVPNFDKCFYLSQTTVLEVIATFRDTSKSGLKIEALLILGHVPLDRQKRTRSFRGKTRLQDFSAIHPLPYSINNKLPTHIPKLDALPMAMPKPSPPYPTALDSSSPCHTRMPQPPEYYRNNTPQRQPQPPYPNEDRGTHSDKSSISSSAEKVCPYPVDNPKQGCILPYPPETSCLYLADNSRIVAPFQSTPYPKDDSVLPKIFPLPHQVKQEFGLPFTDESSCPYPTVASKVGNPPYPRGYSEDRPSSAEKVAAPYPLENICPYPPKYVPSAVENNPPYPEVDLSQRNFRLSSSVFGRDSPPYAISEEDVLIPTTIPQPPSPTPRVGSTAPYPTEFSALGVFMRMPMPMPLTNLVRNSIGFDISVHEKSPQHLQPTAPPVSELPTPPIAEIDEMEDLEFLEFLDFDSREVAQEADSLVVGSSPSGRRRRSPPPSYAETVSPVQKGKEKSKRKVMIAS